MADRSKLLRLLGGAVLTATVGLGTLHGQRQTSGSTSFRSPASTDAVLQQMTEAAGVIFAGQVISIQRPAGYAGSTEDAAEGIVTIEFRVDQAVRGCVAGSVYTLKEWAGLWTGSMERYRAGQRLLLFLYRPNAQGLSSTVHGTEGAVPLRGGGVAPGPYDINAVAGEWVVDLSWVQAQARREEFSFPRRSQRPTGGPVAWDGGAVREARGRVDERIAEQNEAITPWTSSPAESTTEMRPLSQVLSQCQSWIGKSDASR